MLPNKAKLGQQKLAVCVETAKNSYKMYWVRVTQTTNLGKLPTK